MTALQSSCRPLEYLHLLQVLVGGAGSAWADTGATVVDDTDPVADLAVRSRCALRCTPNSLEVKFCMHVHMRVHVCVCFLCASVYANACCVCLHVCVCV